jgi:hypothetical protein
MNRVVSRLGLSTLALVAGVVANAQSTTTGAISGTVTDGSGKAVAGATITASSTQITRTTTTGPDGSYRLGLLNPGEWTLRVSRSGLSTLTQKVFVTTNATQVSNFKMGTEAAAVIEVTGSAGGVDTTTTQVGASYTLDTLRAVPLGRDMNTIANLAPGVVSSGFGMGASISGGSAAENTYILDGLTTTDFRYGGIGNSLVTDFIDQVEVQTGGFKPEFSALGGVFNVVTKSGSNDFRGSSWITWDARNMQASPKKKIQTVNGNPVLFQQGNPVERYDVGFEVGGPLIKDKLFYFVGAQGDFRDNKESTTNNSGFKGTNNKVTLYQFIGKLNWYISTDMQMTFFANYNPYSDKLDRAYAAYGNGNLGREDKGNTQGYNVTFDWTINSSLFLSAKLGQSKNEDEQFPTNKTESQISDAFWFWNGGTLTDSVANLPGGVGPNGNSGPQAVATPGGGRPGNYVRGGFGLYQNDFGKTDQAKVDLSWFAGNHTVKGGVSFTKATYRISEAMSGDGYAYSLRRTNIGLGTKFYVIRTTIGNEASVVTDFSAIYLQDTWEMMPGFKFAFGFRAESQDLQDSKGRSFLKFDYADGIQPRLGLIWDVNRDGKTKVSANYAKYFENIPQRVSIRQRANEFFDRYYSVLTDYKQGVGVPSWGADDVHFDFSTPFSYIPIMHGLELPERNEYILGIDHTLANGWTVGVHAKQRVLTNPIEDITPYEDDKYFYGYRDKGTDWFGQAILANPRPGNMSWTTTATSQSRLEDHEDVITWNSIYPEAKNTYQSVDLTLDKKTERAYVSFSYTWSRLFGNYEGVVSASNGQADGNITASWDYPNYVGEGYLPTDRTHAAKLQGSYAWDLGMGRLTAGINYTFVSGTPRSLLDNGATSTPPRADQGGYGNAIPQNGLFGQYGRTPTTQNTDLRFEYEMKFGKKLSVSPSVDIFNAFNSRKALGINSLYTDGTGTVAGTWGLENSWQTGRRFRFGVKVRF